MYLLITSQEAHKVVPFFDDKIDPSTKCSSSAFQQTALGTTDDLHQELKFH